MFCGACSQQMNPDARFCCHCGKPIEPHSYSNSNARIMRPRYGRMVGGVCSGIAQHYGWDPALVRVLTVVLALCACGWPVIAYIAAWIIIPNEPMYFVTPPPPPTNYAGSAPIS